MQHKYESCPSFQKYSQKAHFPYHSAEKCYSSWFLTCTNLLPKKKRKKSKEKEKKSIGYLHIVSRSACSTCTLPDLPTFCSSRLTMSFIDSAGSWPNHSSSTLWPTSTWMLSISTVPFFCHLMLHSFSARKKKKKKVQQNQLSGFKLLKNKQVNVTLSLSLSHTYKFKYIQKNPLSRERFCISNFDNFPAEAKTCIFQTKDWFIMNYLYHYTKSIQRLIRWVCLLYFH